MKTSKLFLSDWARVGCEEGEHFLLLSNRLEAVGSRYGALPAHNGLWEAAEKTAHDLLARLVAAPMILEARGLDVTPKMIEQFKAHGDEDSAHILMRIYEDEIGHVAAGVRWFTRLCEARALPISATFRIMAKEYFPGGLKPPFNHDARLKAGLNPGFYESLAQGMQG